MTSKRDQIIDTTCELMETQGYHATGLNQILSRSGAPKGSLYYYFPEGKEELAEEAIQRSSEVIGRRIREMMATEEDAVRAIPSFIRGLAVQVDASGYKAGGPITAIALESASTNDRLRESCRQAYQDWQDAFAAKLRADGFADGRARRLGALIIAALEGGIILSRTERSPQPLRAIADEVEILLRCAQD